MHIEVAGRVLHPPGYLLGMRTPAMVAPLKADCAPEAADAVAQRILDEVARLQLEAGWAIFEAGGVVRQGRSPAAFFLLVPTVPDAQSETRQLLLWTLQVLNAEAAGEPPPDGIDRLVAMLKRKASPNSNMPRFLRAAYGMGLPFAMVARHVYAFGQGARARWLDSTYTDVTPSVGSKLARDKVDCASVLRKAGMPAPRHLLVADEDEAVRTAEDFGYPVVVKPADLDGGAGVAPGLQDAAHVREAFTAARALSRRVLVEKHFEGSDVRLTIFQDKLLWATVRQPGGVTGDGEHTIAQLLVRLNEDPRRGEGPHSILKILKVDDEAHEMLAEQSLAMESVPPAGHFVRLRRAPNVVRGGMPVAVTDKVHPDNVALGVRAARALRLDLAGVDLLIPDIARSWLESGALICEVNAQPTLGLATAAHLYAEILRALVPGDGRIPIAVVAGMQDSDAFGRQVAGLLAQQRCEAGWAGPGGAFLREERLADGPLAGFEAGQLLLMERRVEAAIVFVEGFDVLHSGLPFDRFDVLLVDAGMAERASKRIVNGLAPACTGPIGTTAAVADAASWLAAELVAARQRHEAG